MVEPVELPAKGYIDHLFDWIKRTISNEQIFPPSEGTLLTTLSHFQQPHSHPHGVPPSNK